MKLRYVFITHVISLGILLVLGIFGTLVGTSSIDAAFRTYPLRLLIWVPYCAFVLSLLWLYVQSWVMLKRGWSTRTDKENTNLFLILLCFNIPASYWFYWKRYEIDPTSL